MSQSSLESNRSKLELPRNRSGIETTAEPNAALTFVQSTSSPPLRVPSHRQTSRLIDEFTQRHEPSPIRVLTPPG